MTRANCSSDTSGPICVSGSRPGPTRILPGLRRNAFHQPVEHAPMREQARTGRAALAHVEEDRARRAADRDIHVGIGKHDRRRLAAKFQRHLLQVAGRRLHDQLADFRRTGERHLVHVGMRRQRCAGGFAEAGDDVHHAWRKADLLNQSAKPHRRQWRLLGRLQHDRAARRQRRRQLPGRHHQREIPRNDLADHADRLAQRIGVPVSRRRDRHGLAVQARRPTRHVAEHLVRARNIDRACIADRLAVVQRLERGEFLGIRFERVAQAIDQLAALQRRHTRPRAALERAARGRDRGVDVGRVAFTPPWRSADRSTDRTCRMSCAGPGVPPNRRRSAIAAAWR